MKSRRLKSLMTTHRFGILWGMRYGVSTSQQARFGKHTAIEQDGWTAREEMHRRAQKAEADAERWKREVDDYRRRATWWADRYHDLKRGNWVIPKPKFLRRR